MSQRTSLRGSDERKYRSLSLSYKERYNDTNKEDSFKRQGRETLRDLTNKYLNQPNTIKANENKANYKSFRKTTFEKDLLKSSIPTKDERNDYRVQSTLDTNKFFNDLSKEKTVFQSKINKKSYSKIEIENYFENIYGINGIKGMVVDFYDLESIKNKKPRVPEWLLRDNSEELFEAELPPQDITVYNLWFFRRKNEGSPDFVQKGTKPISKTEMITHLEKIYNNNKSRETRENDTNKSGSKLIRFILDELRKVNNYTLYIGSETRYPNNVMEKTPKLIEKLEKILERIRSYKNHYEENKYLLSNDGKAIKYAKELLDVVWMNFNVRTIDISKNRVMFREIWVKVNKELEEIIGKYFNRKRYIL
ncbi:hypothetical protein RclHR1_08890003 [Rhizophagus clarus]|uniref:Uncharacterized protein n=1 Tax=Rhizophagus clarus TaxID=94130 RepID=A0A2Z6S252_9GLOM|nr:hypothetical protein RclHR1_08890003 [Rhizophagus clarus]GES99404.1 hypothetical protein GLOIN_2v1546264 [Rhizophagus clarus]